MLTDAEYLDLTEANLCLNELNAHVTFAKPEDPVHYAQLYFKKVKTGLHVYGTDYENYIAPSLRNSCSLVYCMRLAFVGFAKDAQLTPVEFYHLSQSLTPSFPKSIIIAAAKYLQPTLSSEALERTKIVMSTLSCATYFQLIFGKWVAQVNQLFVNNGSLEAMDINFLHHQLNEIFQNYKKKAIPSPPMQVLSLVLNKIVAKNRQTNTIGVASSSAQEKIKFLEFMQELIKSPDMKFEVYRLSSFPDLAVKR